MTKYINQTENGKIFRCSSCNKIHIEFNNLNFNFNDKEYAHFANYFLKLNGKYWEEINLYSNFKRKIIVPVGHKNVNFLLNNKELQELKQLLSKSKINFKKIELIRNFQYNYCSN